MKKFQILISILFFLLVGSVQHTAHAEVNNVKDCIEHPDTCSGQQTNGGDGSETGIATSVTFVDYLKMIIALVFVVALIYLLLKFINQKGRSFQQTKLINHLGGAPLGGNRSVQIVKVGKQVLVLGVGEDIQLLKEVKDEGEKEEILSYYKEPQIPIAKTTISSLMTKLKGTAPKSAESSFQSQLKSQLEEMNKGRKKMLEELKNKGNHSDE
ncbi:MULTISPECIES: flagellar biosynthetic protein FliO [Bacillaceae]|uniref:flagellar biosynthetic protein FliO n=1 Tax=Bacillaceae TaxID=186817 RepID=UPI001C57F1D8|nr:flagellar biosynthetic protein FliO [Rossellomorea sp. YZS02]MBW3113859.1 flagellar biosynthetic protein FliO [Bacillus sp. MCCB 382]MDX8343898.1 flagellar biosynthetic protein FliO [Rossellomorea sp. YZS02]